MLLRIAATPSRLGLNLTGLARASVVWSAFIVAVVFLRYIFANSPDLFASPGGPDDATRLLQMRELLAGGPWFDRSIDRIGAPQVLTSHWSRFVDLAIAALASLATVFATSEGAELAARILWPAILLFALCYVVLADVKRQAGGIALVAAAILILNGYSALVQFYPGRIDHHNVQIVCAVAGIMVLQRALANPSMGWIAGALFGICLITGLEALPLLAGVVAVAIAIAAFEPELRSAVRRAVRACLGVLLFGFAATTSPSRWGVVVCDELSANLLFLLGAVAITLTVLKVRYSSLAPRQWLAVVALGGCAGLVGYLAFEPACVAGPFGQVDVVAKEIWMRDTIETMSLLSFAQTSPAGALSFIAFVGIAIGVSFSAWRTHRDAASLFTLATIVIVSAYSMVFVKLMPYAMWIAIPIIAVWSARLPAAMAIEARFVRIGTAVLVSQATLVFLFGTLVAAFSNVKADSRQALATPTKTCQRTSEHLALASLPPGVVAGEVDLGPYIALNSKHKVVAAPYHRLDESIVLVYRIFGSRPEQAKVLLREVGASYVVVCQREAAAIERLQQGTLMYALQSGADVQFLEPVAPGTKQDALKIWRVRPRTR